MRRSLFLVLMVLALTDVGGAAWGTSGHRPLPDTVTLFVAVPADGEVDRERAEAAVHEVDLALSWVEEQVGRELRRGDRWGDVVRLPLPESAYVGSPRRSFEMVQAAVAALSREVDFPIVMTTITTDAAEQTRRTCGMGSPLGIVMTLDNCPSQHPSVDSTWGSPVSLTLAHEVVHGLGAVAHCGHNATGDGHVSDDPHDILYRGTVPDVDPDRATMDVDRDDYLGHGIPGCPDISMSPLWRW